MSAHLTNAESLDKAQQAIDRYTQARTTLNTDAPMTTTGKLAADMIAEAAQRDADKIAMASANPSPDFAHYDCWLDLRKENARLEALVAVANQPDEEITRACDALNAAVVSDVPRGYARILQLARRALDVLTMRAAMNATGYASLCALSKRDGERLAIAEPNAERWAAFRAKAKLVADEDGGLMLFCYVADCDDLQGATADELAGLHGVSNTHEAMIADPDRIDAIWDANRTVDI